MNSDVLILEIWGVWNTPILPLLPGPLCARVVVPVRVLFMVLINLFQNYLYSIKLCEKISQETTIPKWKYKYFVKYFVKYANALPSGG